MKYAYTVKIEISYLIKNKMLYSFRVLLSSIFNTNDKRDLKSFKEVKLVRHDSWNHDIKTGVFAKDYIWRVYFEDGNQEYYSCTADMKYPEYAPTISSFETRDNDEMIANKGIGYISYRVATGQIGLFFIKKEYQNCGIGKQILLRAIEDIKHNGCNKVFAVTSKDHTFWSNVFKSSFKWSKRPDDSVTGSGYCLDLNNFDMSIN